MNLALPEDEALKSRLSNDLVRLASEFSKDYNKRMLEEVHKRGHADIRPSHSSVFSNLGLGAVRVTELARRAGVTQQAMGKMLKELEHMGYVVRAVDTQDRRAKSIQLTTQGRRLIKDSVESADLARRSYAEQIGGERLDALESLLSGILRDIGLLHMPEAWLHEHR